MHIKKYLSKLTEIDTRNIPETLFDFLDLYRHPGICGYNDQPD